MSCESWDKLNIGTMWTFLGGCYSRFTSHVSLICAIQSCLYNCYTKWCSKVHTTVATEPCKRREAFRMQGQDHMLDKLPLIYAVHLKPHIRNSANVITADAHLYLLKPRKTFDSMAACASWCCVMNRWSAASATYGRVWINFKMMMRYMKNNARLFVA